MKVEEAIDDAFNRRADVLTAAWRAADELKTAKAAGTAAFLASLRANGWVVVEADALHEAYCEGWDDYYETDDRGKCWNISHTKRVLAAAQENDDGR